MGTQSQALCYLAVRQAVTHETRNLALSRRERLNSLADLDSWCGGEGLEHKTQFLTLGPNLPFRYALNASAEQHRIVDGPIKESFGASAERTSQGSVPKMPPRILEKELRSKELPNYVVLFV